MQSYNDMNSALGRHTDKVTRLNSDLSRLPPAILDMVVMKLGAPKGSVSWGEGGPTTAFRTGRLTPKDGSATFAIVVTFPSTGVRHDIDVQIEAKAEHGYFHVNVDGRGIVKVLYEPILNQQDIEAVAAHVISSIETKVSMLLS